MRIEHWLYTVPLRLRSLFRGRKADAELDEELAFHIGHKTEEFVAQGMTPHQARLAALRAMDGLTQHKEECRDARRVRIVEDTLQDVRYAARILRKSPGFTAVAALTLALAIGANSVVFGILNALVLRPVDLPQAETLYSAQRTSDHYGAESYPNYLDLRDRNRSFDGLAAYSIETAGIDSGDSAARAWVEVVSGNFFDVLRLQPHLGRYFHATDEHGPNSAPYIVLSHGFWRSHFHDDPTVIGRVVRLNKHPFTIVGVAQAEFHGTMLFFFPDFYVPIVNQEQLTGSDYLNARANRAVFQVFGHLKPGVTPEQAQADFNALGSWLGAAYPNEVGRIAYLIGRPTFNGDFLGRPIRAFVAGLMLLSALILAAACANLGSLFAARAADRGREVALRLALGANRNRILRQFLTETVLVSLLGGAVGLAGSILLLRGLSGWQPLSRFPIYAPVRADFNVYAVSLALALASGLLFGLLPARQLRRTDPYQIIKAGPTGAVGHRVAVRDLLLVAQVAICALLVTSSVVAVRGLERSLHSRVGFDPENVLLANTNLTMAGYRDETSPATQKLLLTRVQAIPGVPSAAITSIPPLDQGVSNWTVFRDETVDLRPVNAAAQAFLFQVSPNYLQTAGTALLAGRDLSPHDDANAPRAAVVNRTFARKFFGSETAALQRYFKTRDGARIQIVGICEDGKYFSLTEDPAAAMFFPLEQAPASDVWLMVRSTRQPSELSAAIRAKLREIDPAIPAFIVTWSQDMEGALFASRVATVALGVMGLMGAVLAVTGIFGMAAYSVSKRLRELGIRMALGAKRRQVLEAGLGRALKLMALGSAAGLVLGILFTRVLAAIVYQATPRDPLVLGGVVAGMLLLGLLATWIPARRALSLNPLALLREE